MWIARKKTLKTFVLITTKNSASGEIPNTWRPDKSLSPNGSLVILRCCNGSVSNTEPVTKLVWERFLKCDAACVVSMVLSICVTWRSLYLAGRSLYFSHFSHCFKLFGSHIEKVYYIFIPHNSYSVISGFCIFHNIVFTYFIKY